MHCTRVFRTRKSAHASLISAFGAGYNIKTNHHTATAFAYTVSAAGHAEKTIDRKKPGFLTPG